MVSREQVEHTTAKIFLPFQEVTIDGLSFAPVPVLESLFPGYLEGTYFMRAYKQDPQRFVPSPSMLEEILFAGNHNEIELKDHVYQRIHNLNSVFELPKLSIYGFDDKDHQRTSNVIHTLDLIERSMEGELRNTGEKLFCHTLRVVNMAIDFVYDNMNLYNKKEKNIYLFMPSTIEILLLACALHDFVEPEKKADSSGKKRVHGDVSFLMREPNNRKAEQYGMGDKSPGIWIQRYGLIDERTRGVVEQLHLADIDDAYYKFLKDTLFALNSSEIADSDATSQVSLATFVQKRKLRLYQLQQSILHVLPHLVKLFDRLDNGYTRTFVYKDDTYQAAEPVGIIQKTHETLGSYQGSEDEMLEAMGDVYTDAILEKLPEFVRQSYHLPKHEAILNKRMWKWMPTRWAKLTLLGLGPDQILKPDPYYSSPVLK